MSDEEITVIQNFLTYEIPLTMLMIYNIHATFTKYDGNLFGDKTNKIISQVVIAVLSIILIGSMFIISLPDASDSIISATSYMGIIIPFLFLLIYGGTYYKYYSKTKGSAAAKPATVVVANPITAAAAPAAAAAAAPAAATAAAPTGTVARGGGKRRKSKRRSGK